MNTIRLVSILVLSIAPSASALAETGLTALTVTPAPGGGSDYSLTLQALALMTVLTLLPAFLLMMTSFTRIIIVLAILRQALGTAQTPSNQILIGLSLFLSFFVMSPVAGIVYTDAVTPYLEERLSAPEALKRGLEPVREFMLAQTRESDLELFLDIAGGQGSPDATQVPLSVLLPAFVTSELKTAFQIGFVLFLPFLILDLVVASVLMSMGMMMLSPLIVSLPLKLMLFVLVDGWALVLGTLASGFYV